MEEVKEIILRNRYPENKVLLRKTGVDWTLESNAYYHRCIINDDGSLYAVDPEGGPFLAVDGKIQNYTIKSIKEINGEYVFTLEDGIHN